MEYISFIVGDAEVFIVVAALLEIVDCVRAYTEMQIQYSFVGVFFNFFLGEIDVLIHLCCSDIQSSRDHIWERVGLKILNNSLSWIEFMVAKLLKSSQMHHIKHLKSTYIISYLIANML